MPPVEVSTAVDQSPSSSASDGLPARVSGAWVLDKKVLVEKYLGIFTKGVAKKWSGKLAYVDLFSGPGKNVNETQEKRSMDRRCLRSSAILDVTCLLRCQKSSRRYE